jgi:transposase
MKEAVGTDPLELVYGFSTRSATRAAKQTVSLKQAMRKDAPEALVFQDEVEIYRHPTRARMGAPLDTQPEAPAPGQNEKKVVYGGVDFKTGKITYTIADSKSGRNFLIFLIALVKSYAGRGVRLGCDNGRFYHTKAVQEWLDAHRDRVEISWLPPYSPSLNLIERLWGRLKRTVLANVLFGTRDDLVAALRRGDGRLNGHQDRMGFMLDHDDFKRRTG